MFVDRARRVAVFILGVAAACLAPSTPSWASGLSAPAVGTSRSGPATADPAAVWWNPATLGLIEEPHVLGGASLIVGHLSYERNRRATYQLEDSFDFALPVSPESIDTEKSGRDQRVSTTPLGAAPALFAAVPIRDNGWVLGLGLYAPYAAVVDYPEDGPQRWALREATIAVTHLTAAVAWRPSPRLSVGAGLSGAMGFAELSRQLDMASVENLGNALGGPTINQANDFGPNAPPAVRELSVLSRDFVLQEAIGFGATFNIGVTVLPTDTSRVGLTYRHGTRLKMRGDFQLDLDDDFFTRDLASQGLQYPALVAGEAELTLDLPAEIFTAFAVDVSGRLTLGATVGATFWSSIDAFEVVARSPEFEQPELGLPATESVSLPRNWNDTLAVEALAEWRPRRQREIWGVVGYQSSAVPDETADASSPDGHRLVFAVGTRMGVSERLSVVIDAEVNTVLPRTVTRSDYDLGNGDYRMTIASVGAMLDWRAGARD